MMSTERFSFYRVENVITEASAEHGDYASSEPTATATTDLRGALSELQSDCWDTVDLSGNSIIAYPADYHQDMSSGDYEGAELIISGAPRHLERLLDCYEASRR